MSLDHLPMDASRATGELTNELDDSYHVSRLSNCIEPDRTKRGSAQVQGSTPCCWRTLHAVQGMAMDGRSAF